MKLLYLTGLVEALVKDSFSSSATAFSYKYTLFCGFGFYNTSWLVCYLFLVLIFDILGNIYWRRNKCAYNWSFLLHTGMKNHLLSRI